MLRRSAFVALSMLATMIAVGVAPRAGALPAPPAGDVREAYQSDQPPAPVPAAAADPAQTSTDATPSTNRPRRARRAAQTTPEAAATPAAAEPTVAASDGTGNGGGRRAASAQAATTPAPPVKDIDCSDFETQEAAQAVYDQDPSDPYNLDPSGDGVACSLLPSAAERADPESLDAPIANGNVNRPAATNTPTAGNNRAQGETPALRCSDFASQADAQSVLDEDPSDPYNLDPDSNGVACEELADGQTSGSQRVTQNANNQSNGNNRRQANRQNNQDNASGNQNSQNNQGNNRKRNQKATPTPEETPANQPARSNVREVSRDYDCIDFEFQEDAQAVYDKDPSDPYNLDPNKDGVACSSLPHRTTVTSVPKTGSGPPATSEIVTPGLRILGLAA